MALLLNPNAVATRELMTPHMQTHVKSAMQGVPLHVAFAGIGHIGVVSSCDMLLCVVTEYIPTPAVCQFQIC